MPITSSKLGLSRERRSFIIPSIVFQTSRIVEFLDDDNDDNDNDEGSGLVNLLLYISYIQKKCG